MKKIGVILFLFLLALSSFSQNAKDSVIIINKFGDTIRYSTNEVYTNFTSNDSLLGVSSSSKLKSKLSISQLSSLLSGVRVSTQFDATSTTTLANVTGLTANVAAGKIYRFEAKLYTTSNVAGGVKVAIAGTATATAIVYEGLTIDAGLITQSRGTALGTAVGAVTAVTAGYITISGTITVNAAGTLTVQFAQNTSNGTASSVLVGSTFVITEML